MSIGINEGYFLKKYAKYCFKIIIFPFKKIIIFNVLI